MSRLYGDFDPYETIIEQSHRIERLELYFNELAVTIQKQQMTISQMQRALADITTVSVKNAQRLDRIKQE